MTRFVDRFEINKLPFWIGWNLFHLPGDRIVVPNPSGLRIVKYRGTPCYGTAPSLMVFRDVETPDSPIRCERAFSFEKDVVEAACRFRRMGIAMTAVLTGEPPDGHVAVVLSEVQGRGRDRRTLSHLAVLDPGLERIVACEMIGAGNPTNQFPVERAPNGTSLIYVAGAKALVKLRFDARTGTLEREASVPYAFRRRTGTTPTLMEADGRRLLVLVDARCAPARSAAAATSRTSRLVAFDRERLERPPSVTSLPRIIDTVENSPAAAGSDVVVTNYTGYTPDGPKDGRRDIGKGVAGLRWNEARGAFDVSWLREDIQISGVPTISTGSGLVYGSGAEADGLTYVYGLELTTGKTSVRVAAGPSHNTSRRAKDAVFDAGNNFVIDDDGSAVFAAGQTLVRVR